MRRVYGFIFAMTLAAGSLSACSSVQYVDNHDLKHLYVSEPKLNGFNQSEGKRFGALRFTSDEEGADRYVMLTKHKNIYAAETLMFDNSKDYKKQFDRGFFSFGTDYKKHLLGFQFRFEY
jgi:hypothetical protein